MRLFRLVFVSFFVSLLGWGVLFSQPPAQNKDFFDFTNHIKVSFRTSGGYYRIGEPVVLEVWFENVSSQQSSYRFQLWENSFEQWKFRVQLDNGQSPFETFAYKRWQYESRTKNQPGESTSGELMDDGGEMMDESMREIKLNYGETFSFKLHLDKHVEFNQAGFYEVKANFYPLSVYNSDYELPVTSTQIEMRQNFTSLDSQLRSQTKESFLLQRNNNQLGVPSSEGLGTITSEYLRTPTIVVSPKETIERLLRAFQLKRWKEYISYLQVDTLMTNSYRSTDFYERMLTASAGERQVIMNEFMDFLVSSADYDIVTAEVLQAIESGSQSRVEVLTTSQEFYQRFREVFNPLTGQLENQWSELTSDFPLTRSRIFTYELSEVNGVWKVVGVEVRLFDGDIEELRRRYALNPQADSLNSPELIEKILFDFNQFYVSPEYEPLLSDLADFMQVRPEVRLKLLGFTDDIGTESYNQILSARRVAAVRDFLTSKGIPLSKIETFARGESDPLNFNENEEERRVNRRVEIYFAR